MNGESSYRRFLEGDSNAIGELVEQYNKSLVLFLKGIVGDTDTAEDAAADAFVQLLVKKPRLKDEGAFKAYLFRTGRNRAIDLLRRTKHSADSEEEPTDGFSLEEAVLKGERDRCLHSALLSLRDDYRDVLHLLYFEEMDYKTAAATMKKSTKQITNLAYRAKGALRAVLEERGFNYEV